MKITDTPKQEGQAQTRTDINNPEPQPQIIPELKRADKPILTQKKSSGSFNLKTIFDIVEEEKPVIENPKDLPSEAFTEADFLKVWNEFLENLKKQNKIPAYNALHTAKISLKENSCISFKFSSLSLSSEFDLQKENLMPTMREKLRNHFIEFEVSIEAEPTQSYVKSKAEIFREMAEKNPVLLKMKNDFGLDFNSND